MAEKIKDAEDRLLESMFESAPIADDGFSAAVVGRIRRRLWLRRLTLPIAALIGGLIAYRPLVGLVELLSGFPALLPDGMLTSVTAAIPQAQIIVLGAMLLSVVLICARALPE